MENLSAVVDAEPCGDRMADGAADGEGGEELGPRHLEYAGGEDEGAERHRWREQRGEGHGEDGVLLHPGADALEDAWRDVFFEEGHATGLADLVAEVAAERGACGGEQDEEDGVRLLGGEEDDHDVGEARDGQRDKGRVDDGDQEDAEDAEGDEQVDELRGVVMRLGGDQFGERVDGFGEKHLGIGREVRGTSREY